MQLETETLTSLALLLQRVSCEAYIHSMSGLGWRLVEKHYDDGGFTSTNVHRPALNQLLEDVKAGLIDVVAVCKVDRLSRRLLDFDSLFKVFEDHHVSFVSITQQIDTSLSKNTARRALKTPQRQSSIA